MRVEQSTSGATIVHLGEMVIKMGDGAVGARIGEQAKWLTKYKNTGIMPVYPISDFAYGMPHATNSICATARLEFTMLVTLLQSNVWWHPPEETDLLVKTKMTLKSYDVWRRSDPKYKQAMEPLLNWDITWMDLPTCLTHGDPTFVNMMELDGDWVLTDPIPSGALPDIRAVDLGKLLQSCMGFEHIVDPDTWYDAWVGWPAASWVKALCENENEWNATIYCGLLHILRLLPYVDKNLHKEFDDVFWNMLRLRS